MGTTFGLFTLRFCWGREDTLAWKKNPKEEAGRRKKKEELTLSKDQIMSVGEFAREKVTGVPRGTGKETSMEREGRNGRRNKRKARDYWSPHFSVLQRGVGDKHIIWSAPTWEGMSKVAEERYDGGEEGGFGAGRRKEEYYSNGELQGKAVLSITNIDRQCQLAT